MKFRTGLMLGLALTSSCSLACLQASAALAKTSAPPTNGAHAKPSAATANTDANNAETVRLLTLLGTVMDIVRSEYVEPVTNKTLILNALNGMVGDLDPHSAYMTSQQLHDMQDEISGQFGGLGLQVQMDAKHVRVVSPIDGTPAAKAGILPGDVILMVDGKSIADLSLDQAVRKMRGKPGSLITLTLLRPKTGKTFTVTLKREIIHVQIVRSALYGRIGYLRLTEFDDSAEHELRKAYHALEREVAHTPGKTLDGLILDLRSDPGGKLDQAIAVARDFIPQGEIVSTRGRHPENNQHWDATGTDLTHGLPIIVLTNSGSASASEIVAGALKDHHRALILGERTFGKGSVQTIIPISDQGALRLTTARYYTPSGQSIQGHGITPDVPVAESRDDDALYTFHESDLAHVLSNIGSSKEKAAPTPNLPAAARAVPHLPPENWPAFNPANPETDFQLQQALHLLDNLTNTPAPKGPIAPTLIDGKKPDLPPLPLAAGGLHKDTETGLQKKSTVQQPPPARPAGKAPAAHASQGTH
ncbi:S41 family peptidase [Oecophyllibacter saccharovorans]|uniref:S41 family peptidase n=1 Tax=Oecophyllibacter saccharovorans TaxID=2558360 RepID=A0A506URD3_9PROT|nr:S41 family peptidase [Oecophyllibacter saccharovorans]TPW35908.1 S41 family peptidase [Oecophyllibacter saccharovorans]